MAGAVAERRRTARPPRSDERAPLREIRPAQPVRRPLALARPGVGRGLLIIAVCVALLAVGRVALSFAVVQKNMETAAVVQQQSALRTQNTGLAAELARLTSTERLERAAAELGLQRPGDVRYLRVPQTLGSRDP